MSRPEACLIQPSNRLFLVFLAAALFALTAVLQAADTVVDSVVDTDDKTPPRQLADYVARPEPEFGWKYVGKQTTERGEIHQLTLVSQTWQNIRWEHDFIVCRPPKIDYPSHMLLFVTGGRNGRPPKGLEVEIGLALAQYCGAPVALLFQVPNQPLMGNRVEDDLISETWLKYLETGDATWPLLFPMVKSTVKAMDALQDFSQTNWQQPVEGFVITGASKRGWTSWLAPAVDQRILGTAPLVIDTLNFRAQAAHQLATWGRFSEQIEDYTRKGLVRGPGTPESERETQLRTMMDPFSYRNQITVPKLLVNGTNDPYWVVDAMSLYWNDLQGPKYILNVANAGHSLDGGRTAVIRNLGAFFRHVVQGKSLPELDWTFQNGTDRQVLIVRTNTEPDSGLFWSAKSGGKDFRGAYWRSAPLATHNIEATPSGTAFRGEVFREDGQNTAAFGELYFTIDGLEYSLTTLIECCR